LEQFNIQVDNPCAVLMQDTSRQFLNTNNAEKYKFFLKATQLEQMAKDYAFISEQLEITKDILTKKAKTLPVMENKVKAYEQEYNDLTQLKSMKDNIQQLRKILAWLFVTEKEIAIDNVNKYVDKMASNLQKLDQKIDPKKAKKEELEKQGNEKSLHVSKLGDQTKEIERQLEQQHHQANAITKEEKKLQKSTQRLQAKISKM